MTTKWSDPAVCFNGKRPAEIPEGGGWMSGLDLDAIEADVERATTLVSYVAKYEPNKRALLDTLCDVSRVANHVPALIEEVKNLRRALSLQPASLDADDIAWAEQEMAEEPTT